MSNEHTRFYSLLPVRTFFNFYKSQLHTSTITTLKHELMNSLLTFSSRMVLPCQHSTNTDLVWVADAKSLQQSRQCFISTSDGCGEICVYPRFFTFLGTYDSEWVILKWPDETGSKF